MNNPYSVCTDRELCVLPTQWLLAELWDEAGSLLYDLKFMEAKAGRVGIDELLQDYTTALRLLPKENSWFEKLKTINRVLDRQAHRLRDWNMRENPYFFLQQIPNDAFAQDLERWQTQAEAEFARMGKFYLREKFPIRSDPAELRTFMGNGQLMIGVALSADGRLAISESNDQTLKVWDVPTGRELRTLDGHSYSVALSADGRLAISADSVLKVWDVPTGRVLRTIRGDGKVRKVALSADGRLAVSVSSDEHKHDHIKVWDVVTGHELHSLTRHGRIGGIALSADGRLVVSTSLDDRFIVWDVATGHKLQWLREEHGDYVYEVALSADGRLAVSATASNTLKVWDVTAGRELHTLRGHSEDAKSVALSADGRLAVSASDDMTLKVWDVTTGHELRTLKGHGQKVSSVSLSADGAIAVSASWDGTIKVWNISTALNPDIFNRSRLAYAH